MQAEELDNANDFMRSFLSTVWLSNYEFQFYKTLLLLYETSRLTFIHLPKPFIF